jgi:uncharacterized protein YaeQ
LVSPISYLLLLTSIRTNMIEKFTFDLQSPKLREKLILVKNDLERREHIVLKLLAYLLFYEPGLKIEQGIDMHYKPDLVVPGDYGVPSLWIDCGQIAVRKVESLAMKLKTTRLVILKETKREMDVFRKVIEKKVKYFERIEYLSFEKGFVSGVGASLKRTNEITLYDVMENVIGLAVNEEIFESELYR